MATPPPAPTSGRWWWPLAWVVAFGGGAALLVICNVVVRLPGAEVVTDPREVIVSLGAALGGPLAGGLIGFLAGIFERIPGVAIPSALGHAAAGAWTGWAYRRVARSRRCRASWHHFVAAWSAILLLYYGGMLYPIGLLASLFVPGFWSDPERAGLGPAEALPVVLADASIEFILTLAVTIVVWWALPRAWRRPRPWQGDEPRVT